MKRTELVFILDRSGSMSGLETQTINGFNSMLEKQKAEKGEANVTTVLFDNQFELLHNHRDIREVNYINERDYYVRGSTALLDAVGKSISMMSDRQKKFKFEDKADKVLFVITTDGMENSSREYSYKKIRDMIEFQKHEYGWEFIFLGANIDAVKEAAKFGIKEERTANYHSDKEGTELNYRVISETVSKFRTNKEIDDAWKEKIEEDYRRRMKEKC